MAKSREVGVGRPDRGAATGRARRAGRSGSASIAWSRSGSAQPCGGRASGRRLAGDRAAARPRRGRAARARARPPRRRRPRRRASGPAPTIPLPRSRAARPRSPSGRRARASRSGSARRRARRSAGRCVTHRTWWSRASAHRLRPTGSALRPPIPASISSNTSVGVSSASARTCLIASATRDSSPPDAIRASGRAGSPGLGRNVKTTVSTPVASNATASPSSSTAGSSPCRRPAAQATSKASAGKPELGEDGRRRPDPAPRRSALAGSTGRPPRRATASSSRASSSRAASALGRQAPQPLELGRGALAVRDDRRLVVAVAALEPVDLAEPLLERGERRRVVVDGLGEVAHLARRRPPAPPRGRRAGRPAGPKRSSSRASVRSLAHRAGNAARGRRCPRPAARRGPSPPPGDRLAVLRRRQPAADLVRLAGPQARRRRSRPPRARAGRAAGRARAGRSPARPARRGSPASARPPRPSPPAARPCPPNASSRSRCQRSSSSRCWSCWPWISTSARRRRRQARGRHGLVVQPRRGPAAARRPRGRR